MPTCWASTTHRGGNVHFKQARSALCAASATRSAASIGCFVWRENHWKLAAMGLGDDVANTLLVDSYDL